MIGVLFWIFQASIVLWVVAELATQVVQYRRGGRAVRTEWRSLGAISLSIVVGDLLASVVRRHLPALDLHVPWLAAFSVALPLLWLGVGFRLWAIRTLGRFFRYVVHVQSDHQLVQRGPYRFVRHPAYTGAIVAVVGISFLFNNALAMAVFTLCPLVGVLYRINVEERVLNEALGAEYTEYAAHRARLVPGVW